MNTLEYLRQFRIIGFAVFDFTVALLGMLAISPLLSAVFKKIGILVPKKNWVLLAIPVGIVVHLFFNVMTPLTKNILDPNGHYVEKLVVLILLVFGLWGIKRNPQKNKRSEK